MPRRLPVVDALHVREPCPMAWEAMAGGGASRHCAACDRAVWDAASLTAEALAGLVVAHGGTLCLRITRDARGRVVTRDRSRAPGAVALLAALALALAPDLAAAQDAGVADVGSPAPPVAPAPDRDHDTVPDADDACPDQPGAPSPDPSRRGCAPYEHVSLGVVRIIEAAQFQPRSTVLTPRSERVLEAVALVLAATPSLRLRLTGHVSPRSDGAAAGLGMRRAVKVRDWLVDHGVAPDRLEVADAGAAGPLLTETTPHRRALNRRVSFEPIEAPAR